MKRTLLGLAALLLPSTAFAGFGASASAYALSDGTAYYPSLDYRAKGFLAQVRLIDTIGHLQNDWFDLGIGGSYMVVNEKAAPEIEGVIMPGMDVRLMVPFGDNNADFSFNAMAKVRFGAEVKKDMGFGIYVVPQLGVSNIATGDVGLAYGGGFEVSAWSKR
ncbi:MAG: hypothetical protein H6740_22705 [Alphaproteobacteria bacterium]|nr:hypothetical protein [Alphaproteobacteria bacterium]